MDSILAIILVAAVPAYMLWRGRNREANGPRNRMVGIWRTVLLACGLLALLAASWLLNGRQASDLGLAFPWSFRAQIGLVLAVVVLAGFALGIAVQLRSKKIRAEDMAKALEGLPQTKAEAAHFIPQILLVCAAWEVLYRGFLLWFLTPRVGLAGAVAISAAAYALAHGYQGARRFAGSLASALLFTVGYAVTQNLWWLILIHAGFPVLGSLASLYRRAAGPQLSGAEEPALPSA